jgi:outer membrane protein assembly factor BamB
MGRQSAVLFVLLLLASAVHSQTPVAAETSWGQWRGPHANGIATQGNPPTEWSEDKNIRWKIDLPGEGLSVPIIWGDRVYIQAAIPIKDPDAESKPTEDNEQRGHRRGRGMRRRTPTDQYQFTVIAYDRKTGAETWRHVVRTEVPHEGSHPDGSLAPASPLTDGQHLIAYFGSHGLYCFDMSGKLLWEKDLGDMKTRNGFGEGSSPVIHGNTVVVNWDHEGDSFVIAIDKKTGKTLWKKSRDEPTSWSTPVIIENDGRPQVVLSATNRVRSYDLTTGKVVWECGGLGVNCIPTPVFGNGLIFVASGYRDSALIAINYRGAKGDITGSDRIAWTLDGGTPYVPSTLLYDDAIYVTQRNSGILSCYNAKTGSPFFKQQRLQDITGVYASPIGVKNRVYYVGRNGVTNVLKRGPKFELLAVNRLDDRFDASPAVAGDELFLRGHKHLYCIADQ